MVMLLFMMELLFGVKRLRPPCPAEFADVETGCLLIRPVRSVPKQNWRRERARMIVRGGNVG